MNPATSLFFLSKASGPRKSNKSPSADSKFSNNAVPTPKPNPFFNPPNEGDRFHSNQNIASETPKTLKAYLDKLSRGICPETTSRCGELASTLAQARLEKRCVFLCGNGGSAANANHWANDLLYGAGKTGRGGVRAHSLSANTSVLMCLANDTGYENVFSGQLDVLASPGDLLITLSGSGNSPNILRAIESGNRLGLETWAIVGFDGGAALKLAKHSIHFPNADMQTAEDLQMVVCHIVTDFLSAPEK